MAIMNDVFEVVDRNWRGLGEIPGSGLGLRERYSAFDAARKLNLAPRPAVPIGPCISGEILRGLKKPFQCPAFGTTCTPEHPAGAPMVSSEGACAAYYRYRRTASRSSEAVPR
jgi:hydrogenase expression/formation protein HypD